TGDRRAERDAEPVELVGCEQRADDAAAGQHDDVAAVLLAQPAHFLGHVTVHDPGVCPRRLGEAGGEDDLVYGVEPGRERAVLRGRVHAAALSTDSYHRIAATGGSI